MENTYHVITTTICSSIDDAMHVANRCINKLGRKPGETIEIKSNLGIHLFIVNDNNQLHRLANEKPVEN